MKLMAIALTTLIAILNLGCSPVTRQLASNAVEVELDGDKDGVPDAKDYCLNSTPAGGPVLSNGCTLRDLHFGFRRPIPFYAVEPMSQYVKESLDSDLEFLAGDKSVRISISSIISTCDPIKGKEPLAEASLNVLKNYYIKNGLDPKRIAWARVAPARMLNLSGERVCNSDEFNTIQVRYAPRP